MAKMNFAHAAVGGVVLTFFIALAATAVDGCGGATSTLENAGGDAAVLSDSGSSTGNDGSTTNSDGGVSTLSPACPASVPDGQSACTSKGLECEYGGDNQISCDNLARCDGSKWTVTLSECVGSQLDASACPATLADVPQNTACTEDNLECAYATGVCFCAMDHTGASQVWACFPIAGCPYPRPRVGDTCATDAQQCDYSLCGASVMCTDGTWHVGNGGCHP
jgi:hypothetical protein